MSTFRLICRRYNTAMGSLVLDDIRILSFSPYSTGRKMRSQKNSFFYGVVRNQYLFAAADTVYFVGEDHIPFLRLCDKQWA